MTNVHDEVTRGGFAIVPEVLSPDAVAALLGAFPSAAADAASLDTAKETAPPARVASRRRRGGVYAARNILSLPAVRAAAESRAVRALVEPLLGASARPVRGIFFDKTPGANWKVAWHQDLSIAVRRRAEDAPGYGPWSAKAGVVHVQPPRAVLEQMLTVRLHLDDCDDANGPLKVIPGSHAHGVLAPAALERLVDAGSVTACVVRAGGAVVMRPLILHASSPATSPRHRRVVHLEFAAGERPGGVEWAEN